MLDPERAVLVEHGDAVLRHDVARQTTGRWWRARSRRSPASPRRRSTTAASRPTSPSGRARTRERTVRRGLEAMPSLRAARGGPCRGKEQLVSCIEFLDAGLTRQDQCGRVDAKPTGYCASSVVPFGKSSLLSVRVVVGGRRLGRPPCSCQRSVRLGFRVLDLLHHLVEVVARRVLHRRELLVGLKLLQPQRLADWQHVPIVDVGGGRRAD